MAFSRNIRPLRPRLVSAEASLRPTRAEVDLDAIAHNLDVIRGVASDSAVLAVVKADGYGHGAVPVAQRLEAEGVAGFGVALAEEGFELREAGIASEILVLNGVYGGAYDEVIAMDLTPVIYDLSEVRAFAEAAGGRKVAFHLKVDTGMSRLGVQLPHLEAFLEGLRAYPNMMVAGLMTHLAAADSDEKYTHEQLRSFQRARQMLRCFGHTPKVIHAANTAATFCHPSSRFDWVRPGVALFGYTGVAGVGEALRPAMRIRSEVISLRDIEAGGTVGYGRSFRAERETRVATIPVGYADGFMRQVSDRAHVLVAGVRCPVIGNVSMDLTAVDVTDCGPVMIGQEVVLLGEQGGARIDANELAQASRTIPYEVLTSVSRRVPRFVE